MALTDEQLEIISEAILPLFQYLEKEVIVDIARRIQKTLTYSRTAELQAMSMRELGYSPARIRKEAMKVLNADPKFRKVVAKNTMEYKRDIRGIINNITQEAYKANDEIVANAGNMSWVDDLSVWKNAGKELKDNSFLHQLVESFALQTAGELKNITQTTGFKTMSGYEAVENAYKRELDKAIIKICSGTFNQDKVLKDVVHDLAQSGLRTIDFANGYSMQLDTAARVAIRTGCHQLSGKITDKNIKQTGENLVYVSKHWGARNTGTGHANHEQWQGKIYFIKDGMDYSEEAKRIGQDRIMSLYHATGYSVDGTKKNDPLGLNGYNCRHNHHPWFEGVSTLPKESPEPKSVTINGKTYDYFAMTQKMRSMERSVRALKREKEALKALGMDTAEIQTKISRKTREYKEFCGLCGINPQNSRLRYECGASDLKKTKAWKACKAVVNVSESGIINVEVDELTPCLRRMRDDKIINTGVFEISPTKGEFKDWEFDWTLPEKNGYKVFEIKAEGDYRTQGLVALKPEVQNSAVHVDIVEAAPFNNPHNPLFTEKQYSGIGGHLFAEAVKQSYEHGFDGYVYFKAKSDLIQHYEETLGATLINARDRIMAIDERSAKVLYDRYYGKK